jgi:GNAT superfamily N-acetyltransferase
MLSDHTMAIANAYWAALFGCLPGELFAKPFRIVTHGADLADYCGAFALFRGGAAIASIPSDRAAVLRMFLSGLSDGCSTSGFVSALSPVASKILGPAYVGYAATIVPPTYSGRALGLGDAMAVHELQQSTDASEWEAGGGSVENPSSGVFIDGQLVAMASYEVWGNTIAHISILTHRDFRNRGLGRSAVAHLAKRAIRAGLLPQYRTLESNRASIRVAESLGFQHFATSIAVRLDVNPSP